MDIERLRHEGRGWRHHPPPQGICERAHKRDKLLFGKDEGEGCDFAGLRDHGEVAVVQPHDLSGETQSYARPLFLGGEEGQKNRLNEFGRDAGPVVLN